MKAAQGPRPSGTHAAGARLGASGSPPASPPNTLPTEVRRQKTEDRRPESASGAFQWYALWTMSRAEFVVESAIESLGIESFLPTWTEIVQWSDRKKEVTRPLFPGYLFARCADSRVPEIVTIAGVVK